MSISTYKFFVEKLGDRNVDTFIGDIGEIFYDPLSRTLRISDGTTPGGIPLLGSGSNTSDPNKVSKSGDVMSGPLILNGSPTLPMQAAPKQYVDNQIQLLPNTYYTETEIDNILLNKANTVHDHDDRYYTELEVNTILATKADLMHNHTLDSLSNVTVANLTAGQTLQWNGTTWANISGGSGSATRLDQLLDVSISNLVHGEFLKYDGFEDKWLNSPPPSNFDNMVLDPTTNILGIGYIEDSGPTLTADLSALVGPDEISELLDVDVTTVAPTVNSILIWDGSKWVVGSAPGSQVTPPPAPVSLPWSPASETVKILGGTRGDLYANPDKSIILYYPDNSSAKIKVSTDYGMTWVTSTQDGGFSYVYYLNGKFFIRDVNALDNSVLTSTDGITWTAQSMSRGFYYPNVIPCNGYVVYHEWHPNFPTTASSYISNDGINFTSLTPSLAKGYFLKSINVNNETYALFNLYSSSPFRQDTVIIKLESFATPNPTVVANYVGFKTDEFFYDEVLKKFVVHGMQQRADGSYHAADFTSYFLTPTMQRDTANPIPGTGGTSFRFSRFSTGEIIAIPGYGAVLVSTDDWQTWTAQDASYVVPSGEIVTPTTIVLAKDVFNAGFVTNVYVAPLASTNVNTKLDFKLKDLFDTDFDPAAVLDGQSLVFDAGKWVAGGYTAVPTSSIGVAGNKKGMYAVDSTYLYVCTANHNGTTHIWKRIALLNTTW